MTEYEKYLFDLNGYLVVEDMLTPEQVRALNEAIDHNPDQIASGRAIWFCPEAQSATGGSHHPFWRGRTGGEISREFWTGRSRGTSRSGTCCRFLWRFGICWR